MGGMGYKAGGPARSVRLRETGIRVGAKRRTERMVSKYCALAVLLGELCLGVQNLKSGSLDPWLNSAELALVGLSFGCRADGFGIRLLLLIYGAL